MSIRRICVFCGSKPGTRPSYAAAARALGEGLGRRRLGLVYGGASIGMMGAVADATLANGSEVIGVIPGGLAAKEVAHPGLTRLHVVASMHERKAMMEQLSDGFIALPGGFGTFEELLEIATWIQLGLHAKPVGLLNVEGYYDALLAQIRRGIVDGFVPESLEQAIIHDTEPEALLERLLVHRCPPPAVRWIRAAET